MVDRSPTRSSRSSQPCSKRDGCRGATLVELLVATIVAGVVVAAALSVTLSSRKFYETDQNRVNVNQNLRAALDLVGTDIRQAGERLPSDFPTLEIANGAPGSPDTVIVRRNLLDPVLPVCEQINAGSNGSDIRVVDSGGSPPPGCAPVADVNGDGWPDNIEEWRDHRDGNGGAVLAYIFNPTNGAGEFFLYEDDGSTNDYLERDATNPWLNTYLVTDQARIYLIEQRQYQLAGELLQYIVNENAGSPVNLNSNMTGFQARAVFSDGTIQDTLDVTDEWSDLQAIEITVTGQTQFDGRTMDRELTARFFPRNALSL